MGATPHIEIVRTVADLRARVARLAARRRPGGAGADHGRAARGPPDAGAPRPRHRRPGRGVAVRQSHPVRPQRGLRRLPARRRRRRRQADGARRRPAVRARASRRCIPRARSPAISVRGAGRRPGGRAPARLLHRRRHRRRQAAAAGAAGRGGVRREGLPAAPGGPPHGHRPVACPTRIEGVPTVREADGLALSSRNAYLTADERRIAPALYRTLQQRSASGVASGADAVERAEWGEAELLRAGFDCRRLRRPSATPHDPRPPGRTRAAPAASWRPPGSATPG